VSEPVTLAQLKTQLRLGNGVSGEDGYLDVLIVAARRAVENRINRTIVSDAPTVAAADLPVATQAILMLAAYWYENRDGTGDMPASITALLGPMRRWSEAG